MRQLLMLAHLAGMVLWLGGGLANMNLAMTVRRATGAELALLLRAMGGLYRVLVLPGVLLTVVSGLLLTLRLYGSAMSTGGYSTALMVMQVTGLLAAVVVLGVAFPTNARLARLDPSGAQAPLFAALRKRAAIAGALGGILGLAALVAGALMA